MTRPKCPFYGFGWAANLFMDTEGNQCGIKSLIDGDYSPCYLESSNKPINFETCPYNKNSKEHLEGDFGWQTRIYPSEFFRNEGTGIPLIDWVDYIMEQRPLPKRIIQPEEIINIVQETPSLEYNVN